MYINEQLYDRTIILDKIMELSPIVNDYIMSESYRTDLLEEEITPHTLLYLGIKVLTDEIKNIGIHFTLTIEELLEYDITSEGICNIYSLFVYDELRSIFQSKEEVYNRTISLLESIEHEDDFDIKNVFTVFIELIKYNFKENTRIKGIEYLIRYIEITPSFIDHIKTCLEDTEFPIEVNEDIIKNRLPSFIEEVKLGRDNYRFIVEYILSITNDLNKDYLYQSIEDYDLEKLRGENMLIKVWAHTSKDLTDENEIKVKKKYDDEHHTSNSHHIEYFLARHLRPNKENLIELLSHHVEISKDEFKECKKDNSKIIDIINDFKEEVDKMLIQGKDILEEEDKTYIKSFIPILSKQIPILISNTTILEDEITV